MKAWSVKSANALNQLGSAAFQTAMKTLPACVHVSRVKKELDRRRDRSVAVNKTGGW